MRPRRVVALGMLVAACGAPAGEPPDAGAPPPVSAAAPPRPSALPRLDFGELSEHELDVRACGRCHARHAREWKRSAHAQAFVDPLFGHEWSGDPFCSDCHAPRAGDPNAEPDLARAGVDCATCHVRAGVVHAAEVSGRAPHPSVADPGRAPVGLCASCHQFDFPRDRGTPMQNTVVEWEQSGADRGCVGCHAPRDGGHTPHDFPGHRDPALLAQALTVEGEATRDGWSTDVVLRLEADRVGHAVPTGDVFRRLVVRAWVPGREGNAAEVRLARRFDIDEGGRWHPREDQRVPPPGAGARVVELRLPDTGPEIAWSVDLWSVSPRIAGRFDDGVTLSTRMTQGTLRSESSRSPGRSRPSPPP